MTCTQPGCGGTVQDGYCDTCGLAAAAGYDGAASLLAELAAEDPSAPDWCGTGQPTEKGSIMGCEPNARALRFGLERSYRALARLSPDEDRRIELVDMANAIRPRTLT